ncbi:hypothetical protein GVAV_001615 [Gurleya vavrai]
MIEKIFYLNNKYYCPLTDEFNFYLMLLLKKRIDTNDQGFSENESYFNKTLRIIKQEQNKYNTVANDTENFIKIFLNDDGEGDCILNDAKKSSCPDNDNKLNLKTIDKKMNNDYYYVHQNENEEILEDSTEFEKVKTLLHDCNLFGKYFYMIIMKIENENYNSLSNNYEVNTKKINSNCSVIEIEQENIIKNQNLYDVLIVESDELENVKNYFYKNTLKKILNELNVYIFYDVLFETDNESIYSEFVNKLKKLKNKFYIVMENLNEKKKFF